MAGPLLELPGRQLPGGLVEHPAASEKVGFEGGRLMAELLRPAGLLENGTGGPAGEQVGGHAVNSDPVHFGKPAVGFQSLVPPCRPPVHSRQTQERAGPDRGSRRTRHFPVGEQRTCGPSLKLELLRIGELARLSLFHPGRNREPQHAALRMRLHTAP